VFNPQTYDAPRPWIHAGWLNNLGLSKPANLDEFYNVLVAFRDRDPNGNGRRDEIPMIGGANAMSNSLTIISAAMGFPEPDSLNPIVTQNGDVRVFAANPIYGEFLRYVNRLFSEQLLDNDYFTNTLVQIRAKGSELRVGVHTDGAPFQMTPNERDWRQYEAFSPLTSHWNNTRNWLADRDIAVGTFTITHFCRYPEAATRFADFLYTDKGGVYQHWGPPRGHPDLMGMHDGWFIDASGAAVYDRSGTPFTNDQDFRMGLISIKNAAFGHNDSATAVAIMSGQPFLHPPNAAAWRDSMDIYIRPFQIPRYPVVYFENHVNDRVLELVSGLRDYMTIMDARFITGAEPLSNLPAYLERLQAMGVSELQRIYQDAYNVYRRNLMR
jgi:putative aldouronate transport system substrate-binding protein